jgi:uncharacterized membrane protein affecting hemolysin expression
MHLTLKEAKLALQTVFNKLFTEEKVVNVRIIPKLDDLLSKAEELKVLRERLAYYRDQNEKNGGDRVIIKRGGLCCFCRVEVDAVTFFEHEVAKLS